MAKTAKKAAAKSKKAVRQVAEMSPQKRKELDSAKACDLTLVHYRILKAMSNGKPHTYRDIQSKTEYYSILTAQLRAEHDGSLGKLGLVREEQHDVNGRDTLCFTITAAGKKRIAKG